MAGCCHQQLALKHRHRHHHHDHMYISLHFAPSLISTIWISSISFHIILLNQTENDTNGQAAEKLNAVPVYCIIQYMQEDNSSHSTPSMYLSV